jgi:hypothetical protein
MHRLLSGHVCRTAQQIGLGGVKNGDLLKAAEMHFDVFITSDQNLRYQQNLAARKIAIMSFPQTNFGESNELRHCCWRRWTESNPLNLSV